MAEESPATKGDILAVLQELGSFRTEIKERFNGLEQRLENLERRLDNLEQRVDGLERRLDEGLHEIEVKLTKRMDDFAASLEEQIRDSQTEVLKAMLTTQESNLARFKEIEPLRERIAILERRLLEVEMKLHIPPAA